MSGKCSTRLAGKQRGVAVAMLMFVLAFLAATGFLVHFGAAPLRIERDKNTALVLTEAKVALIGWSAGQNTPGILPCPEDISLIGTPNEGSAKSSCTLPSIGRLPWKTLGVGDLHDGNGDKLWYVISNGFRTSPINSNSLQQLTVDGLQNAAVAIIFSPGPALRSQNRSALSATNVSQYLDLINNSGTNAFISTGATDSFNDKLKIITKSDLFKVVNFRILGEIRGDSSQGLSRYFSGYGNYPFADINADGNADNNQLVGSPSYNGSQLANSLFFSTQKKQMLVNNNWVSLVQYSLSPDKKKVTLLLGNQSVTVEP